MSTGPDDTEAWQPADRADLERAWAYDRWALSDRVWLRLWARHGDPRPAEPLVGYRGATPAGRRGMSWALDRSQAETYARLTPGSRVYRAQIPPQAVLAVLRHGEVVVRPAALGRVEDVTEDREALDRRAQARQEARQQQRRADRRRDRRAEERKAEERRRARRTPSRDTAQARAERAQRRADSAARVAAARWQAHLDLLASAEATLAASRAFLAKLEAQDPQADPDELLAWADQLYSHL